MIRRMTQLGFDFHRDRRLPLDHVRIVKGRQEMTALFCAPLLRRGQRVVKIVSDQMDLDAIAAKHAGLLNLLLGGCHRHENHAPLAQLSAHIGHALRMIPGRRTDEEILIRLFAHRVERASDLVGAHRAQILAFQINLRTEPV